MLSKKLPRISYKDTAAAFAAGTMVFVLGAVLSIGLTVAAFAALIFAGLIFALALLYRKINESMRAGEDRYRQVEELFSLYHSYKFRAPLPALRGWALSPDVANILLDIITREKPRKILDLGSGSSTLLMAYALEKNGSGTVVGIDHEAGYAEKSRALLKAHGLEKTASVKVAPLSDVEVPTGKWRWYDSAFLRDIGEIDLVFVDGPPDRSHFLARYPALPLLMPHLSSHAIIVIDDAFSPAEKEMVKRWLAEYSEFAAEKFTTEKGTVVLRRDKRKND